jgi:hypothetical protein
MQRNVSTFATQYAHAAHGWEASDAAQMAAWDDAAYNAINDQTGAETALATYLVYADRCHTALAYALAHNTGSAAAEVLAEEMPPEVCAAIRNMVDAVEGL